VKFSQVEYGHFESVLQLWCIWHMQALMWWRSVLLM